MCMNKVIAKVKLARNSNDLKSTQFHKTQQWGRV